MNKEETATEQTNTRWAIVLEWFPQNNRSISVLIQDYLCPKCASKLNKQGKEVSPEKLISTIQNCCSQTPNFINERLSILEGIFRLFVRNGNKSLSLEELSHDLGELRGGSTYRTSPETLLRMLRSDRYYGLQEIKN